MRDGLGQVAWLPGQDLEGTDELTAQRVAERGEELALDLVACPAGVTQAVAASRGQLDDVLAPVLGAAAARAIVADVIAASFTCIVMAVRPPTPDNVPRWLADEVIAPVRDLQ
jgi:hypothetical protein